MTTPDADNVADDNAADPGLPGLHSWRALYVAVTLVFTAYVLILSWLSRAFLS